METKIKVHPIFGWCQGNTQREQFLFSQLLRYSPSNNGIWKRIQLVPTSNDADFFVVFSHCRFPTIDPSRTIVFETEPSFLRKPAWENLSKDIFYKYYSIDEYHPVFPKWHVGGTYKQLKKSPRKTAILSTIMSSKAATELQRKRKQFCKFLCEISGFDYYGRQRPKGIECYRGPLGTKDAGLKPYKYSFHCENSRETNYFTEKIMDCFLTETLCFYDGCPNLEDFFDSKAFIRINVDDPEHSLRIVKTAIETQQWKVRHSTIKQMKQKLMTTMNPLNIIHKLIGV